MTSKTTKELLPDFPRGWEEHQIQQIIFIAQNTTALQRVEWIESMLELLKDQMPRRDTIPEYWLKNS